MRLSAFFRSRLKNFATVRVYQQPQHTHSPLSTNTKKTLYITMPIDLHSSHPQCRYKLTTLLRRSTHWVYIVIFISCKIMSNRRHTRSSSKVGDQRAYATCWEVLGYVDGKHTAPHHTQLHGRSAYTSAPQV